MNLGLHVVRKRPDGFHDLETVFYPLNLKDAVESIPSSENSFQNFGLSIPGSPNDNLCLKVYRLLKERFESLPTVSLFLYKHIPLGAGLGGGSADAAFLLQLLVKQFKLPLSEEEQIRMALELGSDCPFFIRNKPCLAYSRGEQMEPIELDMTAYRFVLVHPGIHISTRQAFEALRLSDPPIPLRDAIHLPPDKWRSTLVNDFEEMAIRLYPELGLVKESLYHAGALYASMSGSGSSFYGIFEKKITPSLPFKKTYRVDFL